jgi:hypothetical protein
MNIATHNSPANAFFKMPWWILSRVSVSLVQDKIKKRQPPDANDESAN